MWSHGYFDFVLFLEDFPGAVCNFFLSAHHPYFTNLSQKDCLLMFILCCHFLISVVSLHILIIIFFVENSIYTSEELVYVSL